MKQLRKKVNESARNVGNRVYNGLGDLLTIDIDKKGLGKIGLGGLMVLGGTGCAMTPEGGAFLQSMSVLGASTYLQESIKKDVNPYYSEQNNNSNRGERVIERIVVQQPKKEQKKLDKYYVSEGVVEGLVPASFTCEGNKDLNENGTIEKNELINLGTYFDFKGRVGGIGLLCGSTWYDAKGKAITSKITEKNSGKIIKIDYDGSLPTNASIRNTYLSFYKSDKDHGIKAYTVEWLVDGRLIPTRTIDFFVDYGKPITKEDSEEE